MFVTKGSQCIAEVRNENSPDGFFHQMARLEVILSYSKSLWCVAPGPGICGH